MDSTGNSTIFILYNARASILGKLDYARRKLTASAGASACSACDLTHGGLRLEESAAWQETKKQINAPVKQLHQDELTPEVSEIRGICPGDRHTLQLRDFVSSKNLRYPMVLGQSDNGPLKVLIDSEALQTVAADHSAFLSLLSKRAQEESVPLPKP